jgi:hypothetical protein
MSVPTLDQTLQHAISIGLTRLNLFKLSEGWQANIMRDKFSNSWIVGLSGDPVEAIQKAVDQLQFANAGRSVDSQIVSQLAEDDVI